ncbi:MAG: transcriptional repressor [Alphaproteobacteria bacterium]|jgi:Fur family iron response transcriptional regulator|nr:transcriptional repressor [Alphaproteobacteria bacterium]
MHPSAPPGRPYARAHERLKAAGLRSTRQRLAIARLLLEKGDRHVTAESLHAETKAAGIRMSLATIYNTLHQFTEAGILREVVIGTGRSWFDTNLADHHHFLFEDSGRIEDIPAGRIALSGLPSPPDGTRLAGVDVVVRVRKESEKS